MTVSYNILAHRKTRLGRYLLCRVATGNICRPGQKLEQGQQSTSCALQALAAGDSEESLLLSKPKEHRRLSAPGDLGDHGTECHATGAQTAGVAVVTMAG